jgi:DNA-binding MarR family transcriptional regulator
LTVADNEANAMAPDDLSSGVPALERSVAPAKPGDQIDLTPLEELVGFNIHILELLMYQLFYERFTNQAITPGSFSTLLAIKANPGVRQGALADALMIQRSNMTILVNRLIRAGYVRRRSAKGDNRGVVLFLAEPGERALRHVNAEMSAHEKLLASGLTAKERDTLLRLLQKMARHLRPAPRRNGNGRVTPA